MGGVVQGCFHPTNLEASNDKPQRMTLDLCYMTPKPERDKVALCKFYEWVEVHAGEVLMVHAKHVPALQNQGLMVTDRPKVYKTQEEARRGLGANRVVK